MIKHAEWYGKIEVFPSGPIAAGSYGTWKITYTVGRYGMDNGGRLRLLFRRAWDGGKPQTTDPLADNFVTATTSHPDARVAIQYMPKGGRRPWLPCLILEIKDEPLAEGDQVFITFGETSKGSKGHRAQTFIESDFRWLMDVECFESGTWVELDSCPVAPIIAADPYRLVALAPSTAGLNEGMHFHLKCEDRFGNPCPHYKGNVTIEVEKIGNWRDGSILYDGWEGPRSFSFSHHEEGSQRLANFYFGEEGHYRFRVMGDSGLPNDQAVSNIFFVQSASERKHYWGDLHAQYNNALGTGSVEEAFRYARDAAGVDFTGHQPNDFQFGLEGWEEVKKAVKKFHVPGTFVPFLGYEWSGNTPAGGDRNVHFLHDDGSLHRSSHWHIPDKSDEHMDRYPLDQLYKTFEGRKDVLLIPHVGGRRCDISRYFDPELEPVIEICSCHGRFEWLLHEALEKGYTVGVVGGSDDHTGRPGASYATSHSFGTRGGLAGIFAKELTREGLFAALRARHTYATTGERIWLHVATEDGFLMGDQWKGESIPVIRVQAAGTKPILKVEIFRNLDKVYSHPIFQPSDYRAGLIRIEWGGARVKGRGRHTNWNGLLRIEGGRIRKAETYAFDHPQQGIVSQDEHHISWTSSTSGDHDGLILEWDGSGDSVIHFETELGKTHLRLSDLNGGPIRQDLGGIGQYCEFSQHPIVPGPLTVDFQWKDPNPVSGRNAYWIRLVQEDGEMAWSSPLYFYNVYVN